MNTVASLSALQVYAHDFLTRYSINDADDISFSIDQFEMDRPSYESYEQFDKKYTLLSQTDDTVLVMALESAFANFLLQARYGGNWGEGRLWNMSQADSFTHCCNQIAHDITSILLQKGIDISALSDGKWFSSISDLFEDNVSHLYVQSMVVGLGSHKVSLQIVCGQKTSSISFDDGDAVVQFDKQEGSALYDFVLTLPVILTAESASAEARFSSLLKLSAGDILPLKISDMNLKISDQIIGYGDFQEIESMPVISVKKTVLPSKDEEPNANT
jgi:flagellar motor switch/type III secretory pathway protein FliN